MGGYLLFNTGHTGVVLDHHLHVARGEMLKVTVDEQVFTVIVPLGR